VIAVLEVSVLVGQEPLMPLLLKYRCKRSLKLKEEALFCLSGFGKSIWLGPERSDKMSNV